MQFCPQCGKELSEKAGFCTACGTARASADLNEYAPISTGHNVVPEAGNKPLNGGRKLVTIGLGLIVVVAALLAWNTPISHSDLEHHAADNNSFMPTKAYDTGADFYLFNRCTMFVIVDGEKFTFPGDEQNNECSLANPGDAFKLMGYTRADNN